MCVYNWPAIADGSHSITTAMTVAKKTRLTETAFLESAPQVDQAAGVLKGVKLLGGRSKNNRRYESDAMEKAVGLYNGRKIYVDHDRSESGADRSIDRWAGTIQNARYQEGGIHGDIKLLKSSAFFDRIIEAAEHFPKDIGFSHVADGSTRMDGTTEVVESISQVFSVDLVSQPATTGGIWESQAMLKTITKTVRQILESKPTGPRAATLKEMVDDGAIAAELPVEVPADAPAEADPAEEVKLALEKAALAVLKKWFAGDIEEADAIGRIKKIAGMKDDAVASASGDDPAAAPAAPADAAPAAAADTPEKKAAAESHRQNAQLALVEAKLAKQEAKGMLLESNREASHPRIAALAACPEAGRQALLESWPEKNTTGTVGDFASPPKQFTESTDLASIPYDNTAAFASRLR